MQMSLSGEIQQIEHPEDSTLSMVIVVNKGAEVNVSILWLMNNEEVIDDTHWCWLETIRDHGLYYCKECRENSETKGFATDEDLYHDHFMPVIKAVRQIRELGYAFVRLEKDWNAVKVPESKDEQCQDGRIKLPIRVIQLSPLRSRKGRDKHARAIHALIARETGLTG